MIGSYSMDTDDYLYLVPPMTLWQMGLFLNRMRSTI
jgi:hypothetical protein